MTVPIGHNSDTLCVFSLVVALASVPGAEKEVYEQVFYVQEADSDTGAMYEYWDGRDTRRIIVERSDRALVRDALRSATEHLIQLVQPRVVTFITHGQNLPIAALTKYEMLSQLYLYAGYTVEKGEPCHGRCIWIAERTH